MIYDDKCAGADTEVMPADRRNEKCLNCGKYHFQHHGWACLGFLAKFSECTWNRRYETQSMRDSIVYGSDSNPPSTQPSNAPVSPRKETFNDWRSWGHNVPGDCACGIARVQCEYHR